MKIADVMTLCPYTAPGDTTVPKALEIMRLRKIRHLPIVKDGELIGVLSERDAQLSQYVCQTTQHCPSVVDLCQTDLHVVQEDAPLESVANEMATRKIDCTIIADKGGNVTGIFTSTDACRAIGLLLGKRKG